MNEREDSPSDWYPYQPRLEGWRSPHDDEDHPGPGADPEPATTTWPVLPEPVESSRIAAAAPSHTQLDNTWLPDQLSPHAAPRSPDEMESPPHSPWRTIVLALVFLAALGIAYLIGPLAAVMVGIVALITLAGASRRSTRIVAGLACLSSVLVLVAQLFD